MLGITMISLSILEADFNLEIFWNDTVWYPFIPP